MMKFWGDGLKSGFQLISDLEVGAVDESKFLGYGSHLRDLTWVFALFFYQFFHERRSFIKHLELFLGDLHKVFGMRDLRPLASELAKESTVFVGQLQSWIFFICHVGNHLEISIQVVWIFPTPESFSRGRRKDLVDRWKCWQFLELLADACRNRRLSQGIPILNYLNPLTGIRDGYRPGTLRNFRPSRSHEILTPHESLSFEQSSLKPVLAWSCLFLFHQTMFL